MRSILAFFFILYGAPFAQFTVPGHTGAPATASGGMSVVQITHTSAGASANGSGAFTLTLTQSTGANGLFIFSVGPGVAGGFTGISETGGSDTFSSVANFTGSTACWYSQFSHYACSLYYVCHATPGVTAVTLTGGTASSSVAVGAIEISGVSSSGCIEGSVAQTGVAAGTFSSSATISGNSSILGIFTAFNPSSLTATSGTTWFSQANIGSSADLVVSYNLNQTTTQNVTATSSTGGGGGNVVIH